MASVILVSPTQLFHNHPLIVGTKPIWIVVDPLYLRSYQYHAYKRIFHVASILAYAADLESRGHSVVIIWPDDLEANPLSARLASNRIGDVFFCDPVDVAIVRSWRSSAEAAGARVHMSDTPAFLTDPAIAMERARFGKSYRMDTFYRWQRKRLHIWVDAHGKPLHGSWSFDARNRQRVPQDYVIPQSIVHSNNRFVQAAVERLVGDGTIAHSDAEGFWFPVTRAEALQWLERFLSKRFRDFGPYEDAMKSGEVVLFHSVLSPLINVGLLTPSEVVDRVLSYVEKTSVPFQSCEGFIRQIIGWREYVWACYRVHGEQQRVSNVWNHTRKLASVWWSGDTGIRPLDDVLHRVRKHAYCHHIERLMVLGNCMFLCEIDPAQVYAWFMEWFIDAYDWVMVPNVFGMSQNADGGLMTSKPYFSGSSYILKMSDYEKGPWCELWDGLYWRFVWKHRDRLARNYRWAMMVAAARRMDDQQRDEHIRAGEKAIKILTC